MNFSKLLPITMLGILFVVLTGCGTYDVQKNQDFVTVYFNGGVQVKEVTEHKAYSACGPDVIGLESVSEGHLEALVFRKFKCIY